MVKAPEDFGRAFTGLERLVRNVSSAGAPEDTADRDAGRWLREDARGSLALAKSAILAMRHEAGMKGTEGRAAEARATLHALDAIEGRIDPPEDPSTPPKMPKPAPLPDALKKRAPGVRGFRLGRVEILAEPKPEGWRLSVSHPDRFPSVEELMLARGVTRDVDKTFAAIIPAASAPPDGRGYVVDLVEAGVKRIGGPAG